MGLQSLNQRLQDPECAPWFGGVFPKDTPRNMRFSINFFTSIGLGGLTDEMRAYLKVHGFPGPCCPPSNACYSLTDLLCVCRDSEYSL